VSADVVLIAGTGRSGSTLLGLVLGTGPDAFHLGEVDALYRPWRAHHHTLECRLCGTDCAVWRRLAGLPARHLHLGVAERLEVDLVVDSSKSLPWIWDVGRWARSDGLAVRHVAVWKDPVDLAYSIWKRGGEAGEWERVFVSYYRRYFELGFDAVSVNYRRFAERPEDGLRRLSAALGIPDRPERLRFWEADHHHLFGTGSIDLGSPSPIRPTRRSAEFEEAWERAPAPGAGARALVAALEAREAGLREPAGRPPPRRTPPLWYYKGRALRALRRYRPQPWAPPVFRTSRAPAGSGPGGRVDGPGEGC